jgi:hypothetical protein
MLIHNLSVGKIKARGRLGNLEAEGAVILKGNSQEQDEKGWPGSIWLRVVASGGLL